MSCEIQPARHNHQPTHQQGTKCMPWPKLTKNANFGPNLVVLGQKIPISTGKVKSFVTHITENPPRLNDSKCISWTNFGRFWAKNPFFYWRNQKFVTHITENPPKHFVHIVFWSGIGQHVPKMPIFGPK